MNSFISRVNFFELFFLKTQVVLFVSLFLHCFKYCNANSDISQSVKFSKHLDLLFTGILFHYFNLSEFERQSSQILTVIKIKNAFSSVCDASLWRTFLNPIIAEHKQTCIFWNPITFNRLHLTKFGLNLLIFSITVFTCTQL